MKPQTIGRVLGIGMRVAGRMAGQRMAGNVQAGVARPMTVEGVSGQARVRATGKTAGRATGSLARGVGGFLRPFGRVGSKIFLEVAGLFFFIFVLVFGQTVVRSRASYLHGPDHEKFLVAAALMLLFLYLSASSFWRARRK